MRKINTGITGLDDLLYGGIVQGNCVLIQGIPGAGKTTLGIEFIYRGITQYNEPGVIITCEQFPESIYRDALNFGWDLRKLESINMLRIVCTSPEVLMDTESGLLEDVVAEVGAKRILVDSISHFRNAIGDPLELRRAVYSFCNGLRKLGLTAFLVKEQENTTDGHYDFEEYVLDAVISMKNIEGPAYHRDRLLEITKTRGQEHISGKHSFRITSDGIKVFALQGLINSIKFSNYSDYIISTGISGLDDILNGGFPRGISVAVIGNSGTGKTVLGLQYLIKGALAGDRGVLFSCEESFEHLVGNAHRFGWDLKDLHNRNIVKLLYQSFIETEIDKSIIEIGKAVKSIGAARVVIDSIPGLISRVNDSMLLREKFYYLATYLNSLGCTTLLLGSELDIGKLELLQSIVQGTILLKSTLNNNRRFRHIELYKMRGVNHMTGNHLMQINEQGIQVYPRVGGW
ncbi:ATPase domain-containing protein [Desulfolucanica intricata]|uniref:ATPase domain-containing protein n=1 Tax=Desulfolucanica intricata TaxID=1285191 RepID=UPI0008322C09|nr:ATPase domain-containing protein [Desulfolucanica intricata]